ncbi:MAG: hypothetical protein RBS99_01160 [Rhodospirillales bacterium]|nr:hypothetical protein [Rhodospirillales bacterium]
MTRHGQNPTQVEAKLLRPTLYRILTPNSKPLDRRGPLPSADTQCQHQAENDPAVPCQSTIARPPPCPSPDRDGSEILKSP